MDNEDSGSGMEKVFDREADDGDVPDDARVVDEDTACQRSGSWIMDSGDIC